ncbi:ATP-dependent NAD(P)H-hydrate dehydratase [Geosmithia morbida]|uniref:ATP-dependent (S)-NAD(P)H-hydrate dehydratase n=1 Tax=Geosmithia morbida TaxID=1094350 RepID=A0A9P5D3D4_9HYPO|nr:ATP-dependent NAD(P)H-hydrate dehydratase [Geosmithia morbida]KAF4122431.1 ATP-dependent NAD(P)H-hydrate dehydratase [Geosmithia morbida]
MGEPAPGMSAMTKQVLAKVQRMVPPMLDSFHKGQLGRIAVIGGSKEYTGAPYFSAMASAKLGCDMEIDTWPRQKSHVICTPGAGDVIKTYSPNLMVHPLMRQGPYSQVERAQGANPAVIAKGIIEMFPRLHVLVAGPGLGRDPLMQDTLAHVIRAAREQGIPIVIDADALQVVQKDPSLVRGYSEAVLTPNVVEFGRLCDVLGVKVKDDADTKRETARVEALSRELGGVTIIQKGQSDFISDGETTLIVDVVGGKKRSAGQGDTLTGSVATFLGWRKAYLDGLWDTGPSKMDGHELLRLAAFGGSAITREASRLAFEEKGRSLQASDLTDQVHIAFLNLFGEDEESSKL